MEKKNILLDEMEKGLIREAPVLIIVENTNGKSPYKSIDSDDRITEICDTLSI